MDNSAIQLLELIVKVIVMLCHTVVSEWIINKCIQTSFTTIIDICNSIWTVDVRLCLKSTITRNQCVVMYSRNCTRDNRRTDVAEETMMISEDFLIFHSWWTESAISGYIWVVPEQLKLYVIYWNDWIQYFCCFTISTWHLLCIFNVSIDIIHSFHIYYSMNERPEGIVTAVSCLMLWGTNSHNLLVLWNTVLDVLKRMDSQKSL